MKLKFDPSLEYQQQAVMAVVNALAGQPIAQANFEISLGADSGMQMSELGVGNKITLSDEEIFANINKVQEANDIPKTSEEFFGFATYDESAPQAKGFATYADDEKAGKLFQYSDLKRSFTIEMETGTGKTYVYLRTIFELNKNYGLKKFIIVVPSVAIREGVLKSIELTGEHFRTLYNKVPFDSFVYDSSKLGKVRQFSSSNQIQIMIMNIQSFQKDIGDKDISEMTEEELKKLNVINRPDIDSMYGRKPIEYIQTANPIVIIDEPQSVDNTPKSKRAIANLNPLMTLRYSATHRADQVFNLLYKLDPIKAYDMRLVKRIEVASVRSEDSFNDAYIKLLKTDNRNGIKAQIEIHKESPGGTKPAKIWVKKDEDLFVKSGERAAYKEGYIVQNIDCTPGAEYIEFQGRVVQLNEEVGGLGDEVTKAQVWETVEQHLKKERAFKGKGIKVLSLFFLDRVANYRIYNEDGTTSLGKIGQYFEEAFKELTAKPAYKGLIPYDVAQVHNGYFSQDKGKAKDTSGSTKADEDTYNLIMRDKERLLDQSEPLRFIFSHTALKEGWDNPNVFQICTLRDVGSETERRQQIGRGLRLAVNQDGERVHDESINRLTVIAGEYYEDFAKNLQAEYEKDFGIKFGRVDLISFSKLIRRAEDGSDVHIGQETSTAIWKELEKEGYINKNGEIQDKFNPKDPNFDLKVADEHADLKSAIVDEMQKYIFKNRIPDARKSHALKFKKEVHLSDDFKNLWDRIKQRTRYRVEFDTDDLVARAVSRVKAAEKIIAPRILIDKAEVEQTRAGFNTDKLLDQRNKAVAPAKILPDILAYLQKETELTRHTLVEILRQSGRLSEFSINPQAFMAMVAREVSRALHDLMLEGIQYEKIMGTCWEMSRIEDEAEKGIVRHLNNLYEVQNTEKCLFDMVEYESDVEQRFARDLDNNEFVKVFVKLPRWFKIDTPIGPYNPDWAFVTDREEKLYFVRETKSTLDNEERRNKENQKIRCGKRHFDVIGVDYEVVTSLAEVQF